MLVVSRGGSEVLATLKKVILLKQSRILSTKAFISTHLVCSWLVPKILDCLFINPTGYSKRDNAFDNKVSIRTNGAYNWYVFFQCYEVRGIQDFRVKKILVSLLQALEISAGALDPNVVMEQTLQIISEND